MSIDGHNLRHTLGYFATGITVVAVDIQGVVHAMTANSFTSLSLDPPLVLCCLGKQTRVGKIAHQATRFCVSILQESQVDQSTFFAGGWKTTAPPDATFESWHATPRLTGSIAALACEMHAIHEGGDHWIVVGRVIGLHREEDHAAPLLFYRGRYAVLDRSDAP